MESRPLWWRGELMPLTGSQWIYHPPTGRSAVKSDWGTVNTKGLSFSLWQLRLLLRFPLPLDKPQRCDGKGEWTEMAVSPPLCTIGFLDGLSIYTLRASFLNYMVLPL